MCKDDRVRVLLVTSGSMGDVAPFTGLGRRLQEAGHEVTIATHEPFRSVIAGTGLGFRPIPGDMRTLLPQARGQDGVTSGTDPRALARLLRIARPLIASLGAGVAAAFDCVRPSAALFSTLVAPLGYQIADAWSVPRAAVFLQPVQPTRAFGSVLVGGRNFGPWGNLLVGHAADVSARTLYAGPIRSLRRSLGLPPSSLRALRESQQFRSPTFHGFSPSVVPRPADWPSALQVTGYWWPARPTGWTPPQVLVDFLAAGPPPVFIGFGSMAPGRGGGLSGPVLAAVRAAGVRAVVQAGWSGLDVGAADDVLTIGEVPHDWLFPRTAAVVHHAGAGTTAAGLRAGVPAVPVPVLADQPFWGRRLTALGVAPAPLPLSSLDATRLARALRTVTTNPHYAARASAMASRLSTEDGAAPILEWLSSLGVDDERKR